MANPLLPAGLAYDINGRVYPGVYIGNVNARQREVDGKIEQSLGTNTARVSLDFAMPIGTLPAGQCKLRLILLAAATAGAAYVAVEWAMVASGQNFDTITMVSEGAAALMHTWLAGQVDQEIYYELDLDAATPLAGQTMRMHLTFGGLAAHNLAVEMGFQARVLWE